MVAGIVLGSIALFLLLLLLLPVKVHMEMQDEVSLTLKYGPIRIRLMPRPEKPEKEKKPEKQKKQKKAKKKGAHEEKKPNFFKRLKDAHGISGLLHLAVDLVRIATGTLRSLFSHVIVYHLYLSINVGSDNAAKTAIQHGKICAILESCARALIPVIPKKKRKDIRWSVLPDFVSESTKVNLLLEAGIRPLFVFGAVFRALYRFVRAYMRANERKKQRAQARQQQAAEQKRAVEQREAEQQQPNI